MFNTFVALLLVATVPLAGGQLRRLAGLRLRGTVLITAALLLQILMSELLTGAPRPLLVALHLTSYLLIAVAVWLNRALPGVWLLTLGGVLNVLAISLNRGVMPASARALAAAGMSVDASDFANSDALAHPVLPFLGDVLATPSWLPFRNVISVGDMLILLGAAVLLHVTCASRLAPGSRRRAEQAAAGQAAEAAAAEPAPEPSPSLG